MTRIIGQYHRTSKRGEQVSAFVPFPLPLRNPPLRLSGQLAEGLSAAENALARLELVGEMIPSLDWFIYGFVRKEAVTSSQIEGTQASLVDLLGFESDNNPQPDADVGEVCNYIDALHYARDQIASPDGLPLSVRLLNQTHRRLMAGLRGAGKQPGEVRQSQNWIGGSRPGNAVYVPPPAHLLPGLLGDLEMYLHANDDMAPLVRIALAHVQFETIHPYLDGNGRMGRLLIALLLEHWGVLSSPILYLSLFFKRNRDEYYRRLNAVRGEGDWEGWTDFFLTGVATIADEAVSTARDISKVVAIDRVQVLAQETTSVAATRLFERLPNHPIVTVASAMGLIETSKPTATRAIETLVRAGILVETTGRKRDRSFAYQAYIDRLRIGTEATG